MSLTLEEMEREAYQNGDVERARLLAMAADYEDPEEMDSDALDSIIAIGEWIAETDWRKGKKADLVKLIGKILVEVNS